MPTRLCPSDPHVIDMVTGEMRRWPNPAMAMDEALPRRRSASRMATDEAEIVDAGRSLSPEEIDQIISICKGKLDPERMIALTDVLRPGDGTAQDAALRRRVAEGRAKVSAAGEAAFRERFPNASRGRVLG